MREPFEFADQLIKPGESSMVDLKVPDLYTHNQLALPVHIFHSKHDGPTLFISAAVHGDEIIGVEIIRRIINHKTLRSLRGTLITIPVVNIYGFINKMRYLPDRRDLNRSFPGSEKGSLAARMARLFIDEIVKRSTHGIDLHTGAIHRENLPHIRADVEDINAKEMALAFATPVILGAEIIESTLRHAAQELDVPVIVYEAGEALRFNEIAIRAGVRGCMAVMRELNMLPAIKRKKTRIAEPLITTNSTWARAPQSGILRAVKPLGNKVEKDEILGFVSDPFGKQELEVLSPARGIIIGRTNIPLVNEGEALFHIARYKQAGKMADKVDQFQQVMDPETDTILPDEPPII